MENNSLKVFFLSAEADPFVKVGGLGDFSGSLPPALRSLSISDLTKNKNGSGSVDIRMALPFYGSIQDKGFPVKLIAEFSVQFRGEDVEAKVFLFRHHGLPVYLISSPIISSEFSVYSSDSRIDLEKFVFFSLAAIKLPQVLDWCPNIIHANDWHTAVAVYVLGIQSWRSEFYKDIRTILAVHNLPYMGPSSGDLLSQCGVSIPKYPLLPKDKLDLPLPLGLVGADHIVTVSPSYAEEIQTPEFGAGLDEYLRSRSKDISGILNGIDYHVWNPMKDPSLTQNYNEDNLKKRLRNKLDIQREVGLEQNEEIPLLAMVTRLDYQKGVDLIPETFKILIDSKTISPSNWQLVVLGTGDGNIEQMLRNMENEFSDQVRAVIRFDAQLSHRIYSGADIILIPSRYEPCGLTQMIAMRYGCIPVARSTGGLIDSIKDFGAVEDSTGFLYENSTPVDIANRIGDALLVFEDKKHWKKLTIRGMKTDFSWDRSALKYRNLYSDLISTKK